MEDFSYKPSDDLSNVDIEGGLKINGEGKQYLYEKNGVFYGGDYLPEPPEETKTDLTN